MLRLIVPVVLACSAIVSAQQPRPATTNANLKIVVIAGEGAVNIIQQKTAVAPIVEIRDRNNLPVAGATVTFSVSGSGATFGTGSTLTVVTNAAGQATAAGLTPTAAGAVQVNVTAAFQGQLATATVTQANFATAAQAAQAAGAASGGSSSSAGAAAAGAGGGISATTVGIIGAAVAGGAVTAVKTDLIGGGGSFITIRGQVFSTLRLGGTCTLAAGEPPLECYGPPVGGAVVSTTLDGMTATTDFNGNFDLTTTVPEKGNECATFTLTINATGLPIFSASVRGIATSKSTSRQKFAVSPPTPNMMRAPGC